MSTWICEGNTFRRLSRRVGALLAFAALSGCSGPGEGGLSFAPRAPQAIRVADGKVKIRGPEGYCIVPQATRKTPEGDFLLLASCAAISGSARHPHPEVPALIAISVSANAASAGFSGNALRSFFASRAGRAALSRSGRADDVRILAMEDHGNTFIIRLRDDAKASLQGTRGEYWRAMLDLRKRIVTASVIVPAGMSPGSAAERRLLLALVESLRTANPEPAAISAPRPGTAQAPGTPLRPRPRPWPPEERGS